MPAAAGGAGAWWHPDSPSSPANIMTELLFCIVLFISSNCLTPAAQDSTSLGLSIAFCCWWTKIARTTILLAMDV
jgi:hypothetical protein